MARSRWAGVPSRLRGSHPRGRDGRFITRAAATRSVGAYRAADARRTPAARRSTAATRAAETRAVSVRREARTRAARVRAFEARELGAEPEPLTFPREEVFEAPPATIAEIDDWDDVDDWNDFVDFDEPIDEIEGGIDTGGN